MRLRRRLQALEHQIARITPAGVVLTLCDGRKLRTTENALREVYKKAAALSCPEGDFRVEGASHVLTSSETNSIPGLRELVDVQLPYPAIIASMKALVSGPLGWHLNQRGQQCLTLPSDRAPLIRMTFVSPGEV